MTGNVVSMPVRNSSVFRDCMRLLSIRPSTKPGGLIAAHADIQLGPWIADGMQLGPILIYGLSIVRNKNGPGYWIGFPSSLTSSGKRFPLVEIPKGQFRDELCKFVLDQFAPGAQLEVQQIPVS